MAEWNFYLSQKEEELLKVVCPQYIFSLPSTGNYYFLVFQNACPISDFYLPQAIGQVLM